MNWAGIVPKNPKVQVSIKNWVSINDARSVDFWILRDNPGPIHLEDYAQFLIDTWIFGIDGSIQVSIRFQENLILWRA